jgi:hypothetical protein
MTVKTKCLMGLIALGVVDALIPLPILGLILIYVLLQRPPWFHEMVREVYRAQ